MLVLSTPTLAGTPACLRTPYGTELSWLSPTNLCSVRSTEYRALKGTFMSILFDLKLSEAEAQQPAHTPAYTYLLVDFGRQDGGLPYSTVSGVIGCHTTPHHHLSAVPQCQLEAASSPDGRYSVPLPSCHMLAQHLSHTDIDTDADAMHASLVGSGVLIRCMYVRSTEYARGILCS